MFPQGSHGDYVGQVEIGGLEMAKMNLELTIDIVAWKGEAYAHATGTRVLSIMHATRSAEPEHTAKITREIALSFREE